ncbi:MAG: hypothetical protein VW862_02240, partial [Euryarchaeota archaeon]
ADDGELVIEEISSIEEAMGSMMLHPESREEVRQLLSDPPSLESITDGMDDIAIKIALRDSALLASVDGDYDKSELASIRKIAEIAGISKNGLSKLLDWVNECWKLSAKGRKIISTPMLGDDDIIKN